jgi:hypothetical protein
LAPTKQRKTEAGATVMAYQRRTQRGCGRDAEVASFYSLALRGGNAGLRKEGEREATARRSDRAMGVHARAARRISNVAVAATLRGGDTEGICPYVVGSGALDRGWRWNWPRGTHGRASARCLGTRREGYAPVLITHL